MDSSQLLRAVRRRTGMSQRELAQSTGISASAIAAVEAGRRSASWAVLAAVCASAELELTLDAAASKPTQDVVSHLQLGLGERLRRALGADARPAGAPQPAAWSQLGLLVGAGQVVLHGAAAVAIWLPTPQPLGHLQVCFQPRAHGEAPRTPQVDAMPACGRHGAAPVPIPVRSGLVGVDSPGDLALDPGVAAHRALLRGVARLLHERAAHDAAGRQVRAHRDPDHHGERLRIGDTKRYGLLAVPGTNDTRSWRLDDDPGLAAWLRRDGYPV